jgi:hypothetical protein
MTLCEPVKVGSLGEGIERWKSVNSGVWKMYATSAAAFDEEPREKCFG